MYKLIHCCRRIQLTAFRAWKRLPETVTKEKEREKRRANLRQKVASLLPDFESKGINKSFSASFDEL